MKKPIYYAILMLASISCMEIGMQQDLVEEITFRSRITTKAVSPVSFDSGFNVLSQFNDDKSLFFNETVIKKDGQYRMTDPHYYVHGRNLDFCAVYPKTYTISVNAGKASVAYDGSTMADLVVAKSLNVSQQSGAVDLTFQHILSQAAIGVKASDSNYYYDVTSITASINKGTYSFENDTWSGLSALSAYKVNGSSVRATTDGVSAGDAFTLIPGTTDIIVKWDCKDKTSQNVLETITDTVSVNIVGGKKSYINLLLPTYEAPNREVTVECTSVSMWNMIDATSFVISSEIREDLITVTKSGEVSVPSWARYISIYLVNGGNGGTEGTSGTKAGKGGLGGKTKEYTDIFVTPGSSLSVTVGAKGNAGGKGGQSKVVMDGTTYAPDAQGDNTGTAGGADGVTPPSWTGVTDKMGASGGAGRQSSTAYSGGSKGGGTGAKYSSSTATAASSGSYYGAGGGGGYYYSSQKNGAAGTGYDGVVYILFKQY